MHDHHYNGKLTQVFAMTKSRQIMADDLCLDGAGAGGPVKIVKCHGLRGNQVTLHHHHLYNSDHLINKKTVF